MEELKKILREHAKRYPRMQPTDAVKLIYQNEFGGGHLIRDEKACQDYLRREYASVEKDPDAFNFEEERLAKAFYELPLMRREVLRLLFVCELTPEEISHRLHCSVNFVHLQKSRALKKLRDAMEE